MSEHRTTFYAELTRRRRKGWIFGAISALVAGGVGLVLAPLVTPMVLLFAGLLMKILGATGLAGPAAQGAVKAIHGVAERHLDRFEDLLDAIDRIQSPADMALLGPPMLQMAPLAVPALVAGVLVWLWLRGVFARGGHEDLIVRLGARPARLDDPEEKQLDNIVQEVAIGAGAPAPRLFLLNSPIPNAAALGRSHKHGVVLFTRGLLDKLDRDETEAVAARLICAIGAGDLRVAAGVSATFRTFGFFLSVLDLVLRWSAWTAIGGLLLTSLNPRPSAERLARIGEGLDDGLQAEAMPDIDKMLNKLPDGFLRKAVGVLLLPWLLPLVLSLLYKLVLFLWTSMLLGPPMAALWRNRIFWSDARAVKLARNPEAFARALEKIGASDPPKHGEAFAYLFIAGPTAAQRAWADRKSMSLALTPQTDARVARLVAMGATSRSNGGGGGQRRDRFKAARQQPGRAAIAGGLSLLLLPLLVVLVGTMAYLTAIVMTIGLAAGLGMVLWLV